MGRPLVCQRQKSNKSAFFIALFTRKHMKNLTFSSVAAILVLAGCAQKDTTAPAAPLQTMSFRATITSDNKCTVETLGQTYTSVGQVRGVVLPAFSGTLDNAGYHAVGCWVGTPDGVGGDLAVLFEGDSRGKPFDTGTFQPKFEPTFGGSEKNVSISFFSTALTGGRLATVDTSTGSVVVTSDAAGNRTVKVDVSVIKYEM